MAARPNSVSETGNQLITAACSGQLQIVEWLIRNDGVDIDNTGTNTNGGTALLGACQNAQLGVVQFLIQNNANLNKTTTGGESPLLLTIFGGRLDIVKCLVENGADVNLARDADRLTPLFVAIGIGNFEIVKYLVENNADVNFLASRNSGETCLMLASHIGRLDIVKYLIENNANVNFENKKGQTALILACMKGNFDVVKCLIANNADINHQDNVFGTSALFQVSINGNLDILKYLVENGANLNICDIDGLTPLIFASMNCKLNVVKCLTKYNCDINAKSKLGETALMLASVHGYLDIARCLLSHGADPNLPRNDGFSPLIFASQNGHLEIVKILIEKGANVNQTNQNNDSSLFFASLFGHLSVVQYLVKNNANVHHTNKYGETALFGGSKNGQVKVVECLVENNSDVNHIRKDGFNSLISASQFGHLDVMEYLLKNKASINHRGLNALYWPIRNNRLDVVKYLVSQGIDTSKVRNEMSAEGAAISNGRIDILKYFMEIVPEFGVKDGKTQRFKETLRAHIVNLKKCKEMIPIFQQIFQNIDESVEKHLLENLRYLERVLRMTNEGFNLCPERVSNQTNISGLMKGSVLSYENNNVMKSLEISDKILGKGSFASVKLGVATMYGADKIDLAVKCIDITNRKVNSKLLEKEIDCFQKLKHVNVVRFFGHQICEQDFKPTICLVTEKCDEDLLKHFITDGEEMDRNPENAKSFANSYKHFLQIAIQILNGLDFMHSKSYIHKDIKLSNILIAENCAKIADFGLADFIHSGIQETHQFKGTPVYSAPEVLRDNKIYSAASDVFGCSLIFYEMWRGKLYYKCKPFSDTGSLNEKLDLLKTGSRPEFQRRSPPKGVCELIQELWGGDRTKRPTAEQGRERLKKELESLIANDEESEDVAPLEYEEDFDETMLSTLSQMVTDSNIGSSVAPIPVSGLFNSKF